MKYKGQTTYELEICGLKRSLPVVQVGPNLWVASFVMLGDTQLVNVCAGALASKIAAYSFDLMVGPEAKVVPLLQSLATILGHGKYIVLRKSIKSYMRNPATVSVKSITTENQQALVLDGKDADELKGKRVAVIDDVVSTGGSLRAVERLMAKVQASIVCKAAVLKEGAFYSDNLIYLQDLPVFTKDEE